jgi:hypothetical protein
MIDELPHGPNPVLLKAVLGLLAYDASIPASGWSGQWLGRSDHKRLLSALCGALAAICRSYRPRLQLFGVEALEHGCFSGTDNSLSVVCTGVTDH